MATGDSRLSNSARLLAAQELNRRQIAKEAQERLAKVEAERQKELNKRFDRQREALAKQTKGQSANVVAFQRARLEADIKKQQSTQKEKARIKAINKKAEFEAKKAFKRSLPLNVGAVETLTGRVALKNNKGAIVGFSRKESGSAIRAKKLIVQEVKRREEERTKVTDLEKFLANERRLATGNISTAELKRQIAERKKRGLSKTPQQKRLLQQRSDEELSSALDRRQKGKFAGKTAATLAQTKREGEVSRAKFAQNFGEVQNPNFISARGSSRSFQARAKDSSLQQIDQQLALLQKKRTTKSGSARHNEAVALQIASGNFFGGLSDFDLGNILSGGQGDNVRKAQSARQQREQGVQSVFGSNKGIGNIRDTLDDNVRDRAIAGDRERGTLAQGLNTFSPFAIRAQQDIPDPVTGVTDREVQLFRRQLIEENKDLPPSARKRVPATSEFFSGGRAPRADDPFNDFVFSSFGGVDTTKLDSEGGNIANPFAVDFSLLEGRRGTFSDTQTQADIESARQEAQGIGIFASDQKLPTGVRRVSKAEQERREKRARGLRAQGIDPDTFVGVQGTRVVSRKKTTPRKLQQSETRQFGSLNLPPAVSQSQADQGIEFIPSIPQAFAEEQPRQTTQKAQTQKAPTTVKQTQTQELNAFGLPRINLVPDFLVGAVPKAQQGVQGIIDSPFTQIGSQAIQGAIAEPDKTVKQAQSSVDFFFGLASNTNFLDPTSGVTAGVSSVKGVDSKALNRDVSNFLQGF